MDPTANLDELRRLVKRSLEFEGEVDPRDNARMAELFDALDGWMTRGGFLPRQWHPAEEVRS